MNSVVLLKAYRAGAWGWKMQGYYLCFRNGLSE